MGSPESTDVAPEFQAFVTARQVAAAFPSVWEKTPDETMVGAIVDYINDQGPFHRYFASNPRKRRSKLLDPFWKALNAVERASEPVLESLQWQKSLLSNALAEDGLDESTPHLDDEIKHLESLLSNSKFLRGSMFAPSYGERHAKWHDAATALVPLIRGSYRAAGRDIVDFQTATAAGVRALKWALEELGYHIEPDAIVQFIKRTPKLRDPISGQYGPF